MYVTFVFGLVLCGAFGSEIQNSKASQDCGPGNTVKPKRCGYNEQYVKCKTTCPPQSCEISYTEYLCAPSTCKPGCDCIKDHLRNASNVCIPNDQCPPPPTVKPKRCGYNEQYVKCKTTCPPQSFEILYTEYLCAPSTCEPGCDCIKDHLRNASNICIPIDQYPPPPTVAPEPLCGPNEVSSSCKIVCPPQSCEDLYTNYLCAKGPCESGCNCKDGYLRDANNTCIPSDKCPPGGIKAHSYSTTPSPTPKPECGPNEVPSDCKIVCPPQSCESIYSLYYCENRPPCEPGCDCKDGYLRDKNNTCIPGDQCSPTTEPECGPNEVASNCKIVCPPQSCESIYSTYNCDNRPPCEPGCDCKDGYLRDKNNTCIPSDQCSGSTPPCEPECGPNEVPSDCKIVCPPQSCESIYSSYNCDNRPPCEPGCNCKDGYLRDKNNTCIPSDQCSGPTPPTEPECGPNEVASNCKIVCPPQSCKSIYFMYNCENRPPCESGCNCKDGYLRDKNNTCIPSDQCSGPTSPTKPECGPNEVASNCKIVCPPQSCESIYSKYNCDNQPPCEPGCDCKDGYLRDKNNTCIPSEQCSATTEPECGPNEVASNCKIVCPPQSCESIYSTYNCDNRPPCEPGCDCKDGYLRDKNNTCIPSDQCSGSTPPCEPECGPNEVPSDCKIVCPPQSCESIYSSYNCDNRPPCEPGCNCKDGYLRDKNNTCIPSDQCSGPTQPTEPECGPNEVASNCKIVCPPQSCESIYSKYNCDNRPPCEPGCDCKDGYLRDKNNVCIPSDKCPTASSPQCNVNETYVDCAFRCPNQYCPEDDSLLQVACKPGRPCPPGCACKDGYRRKSDSDDTCILASDCPPVKCTRPNEVWDPCSSDCLVEKCDDVNNQQSGCETPAWDCRPRCVCRRNFCRDKDDICIPTKHCKTGTSSSTTTTHKPKSSLKPSSSSKSSSSSFSSSSSDSSSSSSASSSSSSSSSSASSGSKGAVCEPTCAEPNPRNCQSKLKNNSRKSNGTCQDGYILSEKGGKCIKIEDCPKGCNGDPNAKAKACPAACPSTCDKPNALPCPKQCEPLGCECAFGYLRSELNGKCILPSECPGGNPCRCNETFVACKSGCPTDYCPTSDSRAVVVCETYPFSPCFSGCVCKLNHKRLSRDDDTCIVASECPTVNCTRQHERWNPCPSECQSEYCESANQGPVTCNTLLLNCQPRCTCKKNYFRNADDICIPAKDCPKN